MLRWIVFGTIACFLGVLCVVGVVFLARRIPIRFDSPVLTTLHATKPQIVGFLPYWLLTKADKPYENMITTLTYFGLTVSSDGSIIRRTNPQETEPGWYALQSDSVSKRLSDANKSNVKTSLLVISGDDAVISELISHPIQNAQTMMREIAPIMREKGFEDLNIDIETFMEASDSARANFTEFVRTVKEELVREKLGTLTIDLIPIALVKPKLYDARALGEIVDSVVLMTYDYQYFGSLTSGPVAPIGGAGVVREFDVETAVREAISLIPKEKVLLGIPLYGYQWETLDSASESATIPGGSETISVRRASELLATCTSCTSGIDPYAKSPYMIYPEGDIYKQAYTENETSVGEKIALAQKYKLGGVALWALGYEDDTLLRPVSSYKQTMSLSW